MRSRIVEFIQRHDRFVVTSHDRPDGDALGSTLGLGLGLRQIGKTVRLLSADTPPRNYSKLPGVEDLEIGPEFSDSTDGVIVLECNNLRRTGISGLDAMTVVNIDHHPGNENFGLLDWIDSAAAAVGEMVFALLGDLQVNITPDIATNLYVAILTDTGSFQFSNTTADTFRIVSQLVEGGADPGKIAQRIYLSQPLARLRLLSEVLKTLKVHENGRIAWIVLRQDALERTGASSTDTEGLVNYPLSVEGVQLCAFFRQEGPDRYRVSLRSKDSYNVASVAVQFGGGGHRNAAGLSVEGTFEDVRSQVVDGLLGLFSD